MIESEKPQTNPDNQTEFNEGKIREIARRTTLSLLANETIIEVMKGGNPFSDSINDDNFQNPMFLEEALKIIDNLTIENLKEMIQEANKFRSSIIIGISKNWVDDKTKPNNKRNLVPFQKNEEFTKAEFEKLKNFLHKKFMEFYNTQYTKNKEKK